LDAIGGEATRSGTLNAWEAFELKATATAGESTYAGIERMVTTAQIAKAPFIRLADHYALLLLPVTLILASGAWILSGADPGIGAGGLHRRRIASRAAWHPYQGRRAA
jgi:cation transport ATPase